MSSEFRVEVADGKDRTAAIDDVQMVRVAIGAGARAEVEVGAGKDTAWEVGAQVRIACHEGVEDGLIVGMEGGLEGLKSLCENKLAKFSMKDQVYALSMNFPKRWKQSNPKRSSKTWRFRLLLRRLPGRCWPPPKEMPMPRQR